jgi:CheY-like chemotaxis protein
MPTGGVLTFEIRRAEPAAGPSGPAEALVRLSVRDTGGGMDDEARAHLFEPFFTTKGPKGVGLGLYLVFGIVERCGGRIFVDTRPGAGSTFTIELPVTQAAPAAPGASADRARPAPGAPPGVPTVLVAEDDHDVRGIIASMLREAGFTVLEAPSGPMALTLATHHQGKIDLLLTDALMPEMNGFELARQLTATRPDVLVLVLTGHSDETLAPLVQGLPGDTMLRKPVKKQDLLDRVRTTLETRGGYRI